MAPVQLDAGKEYLTQRRRHAVACAAAALRHPAHVVSGRSAAVLHGLPTLAVPQRPELTGPSDTVLGRRPTTHIFGATLSREHVTEWFGVRVSRPARTVVDVARHDRRDGLIVADAALHDALVRPVELDAVLADATGWPFVRRAREVVGIADTRAESPLESLVRLALHDDGFPAPRPQAPIAGYRVDLLIEAHRLVIEADGRGKYTDDVLWREKRSEQVLRRSGFAVERVVWDDVVRAWPATARRLREAMGQHPRRLPLPNRSITGR